MGLAVGDAIGTTLEFPPRDSCPPVTGMQGGGPFRLNPGEWTDDTSLALCLAESILACGGLEQTDLMRRFFRWWRDGENSVNGVCFDVGVTTREAISFLALAGVAKAGSSDPERAGNGSLMRLSLVAIRWHNNEDAAVDAALLQSETTHAAPEVMDACAYFARLLVAVIRGAGKDEVLKTRDRSYRGRIGKIAAGSWRGKKRDQIASAGYVAHTLEAAIWSVSQSTSFAEAVLLAANLGDDADTVAAVTGQLAGAIWGADDIPPEWRRILAWEPRITDLACRLYESGLQEQAGV